METKIDDSNRQFDLSDLIPVSEIEKLPYIVGMEEPHNVLTRDGEKYINAGDWIKFLSWKERIEREAKEAGTEPDYSKKEGCWFWLEKKGKVMRGAEYHESNPPLDVPTF